MRGLQLLGPALVVLGSPLPAHAGARWLEASYGSAPDLFLALGVPAVVAVVTVTVLVFVGFTHLGARLVGLDQGVGIAAKATLVSIVLTAIGCGLVHGVGATEEADVAVGWIGSIAAISLCYRAPLVQSILAALASTVLAIAALVAVVVTTAAALPVLGR